MISTHSLTGGTAAAHLFDLVKNRIQARFIQPLNLLLDESHVIHEVLQSLFVYLWHVRSCKIAHKASIDMLQSMSICPRLDRIRKHNQYRVYVGGHLEEVHAGFSSWFSGREWRWLRCRTPLSRSGRSSSVLRHPVLVSHTSRNGWRPVVFGHLEKVVELGSDDGIDSCLSQLESHIEGAPALEVDDTSRSNVRRLAGTARSPGIHKISSNGRRCVMKGPPTEGSSIPSPAHHMPY